MKFRKGESWRAEGACTSISAILVGVRGFALAAAKASSAAVGLPVRSGTSAARFAAGTTTLSASCFLLAFFLAGVFLVAAFLVAAFFALGCLVGVSVTVLLLDADLLRGVALALAVAVLLAVVLFDADFAFALVFAGALLALALGCDLAFALALVFAFAVVAVFFFAAAFFFAAEDLVASLLDAAGAFFALPFAFAAIFASASFIFTAKDPDSQETLRTGFESPPEKRARTLPEVIRGSHKRITSFVGSHYCLWWVTDVRARCDWGSGVICGV